MKLFYFTYCYPFGMGEQWKTNELNVLVQRFDEITVVPYFYGGNFDHPKALPPGVKLLGPLFREMNAPPGKGYSRIIFHKKGFAFLKEFFSKKVYKSRNHLRSWIGATRDVIRLLDHPIVKQITGHADKNSILYFYWGRGSSEILPFINTHQFKKVFVRMHRFDLFEYVNDNYIPYRRALLNNISVAAPVSRAGMDHLKNLYPQAKAAIQVFRCGTSDNGKRSSSSADGILRVLSCSGLSPVKRIHLMIRALALTDFPIVWHHVGGGSLSIELHQLAKSCGVEDKFIFQGMMDSDKIMDYYTGNNFDVFVNTSESEGVPVSVMEALAAGIPVMATDVGGTREIIDDQVGKLLPAAISPEQLAGELKSFQQLGESEKTRMRNRAFERYRQRCNAQKLAQELADFLLSEN
ncbi:MAG: glycosyltransferase [Puia sp.]